MGRLRQRWGCRVNRDDEGWGRSERPVINVSWHDAHAYAKWLSRKTGQNWRLPTEAEWEVAARGGSTTSYAFGNTLGKDQANTGNHMARTQAVGKYAPNAFGLYDMHGNVAEWVLDRYGKNYYSRSPVKRSARPGQRQKAYQSRWRLAL